MSFVVFVEICATVAGTLSLTARAKSTCGNKSYLRRNSSYTCFSFPSFFSLYFYFYYHYYITLFFFLRKINREWLLKIIDQRIFSIIISREKINETVERDPPVNISSNFLILIKSNAISLEYHRLESTLTDSMKKLRYSFNTFVSKLWLPFSWNQVVFFFIRPSHSSYRRFSYKILIKSLNLSIQPS